VWEKAFEASSHEEDQRKISVQIMKAAFTSQNIFYLNRFTEKAQSLMAQYSTYRQTVCVMQALCYLLQE
jgi:hypothetical protein